MRRRRTSRRRMMARPPLSPKDCILYWTLIILSVVLMLAFPLGGAFLREQTAFDAEYVIAVSGGAGAYLSFVPMFFVGLPLVGVFGTAYRNRRPLLGDSSVCYGPPEYDAVYPLVEKGKTLKNLAREIRARFARKRGQTLLLAVLMLGSLLVFPLSIFDREQLCENGVVVRYNAMNQVVAEYTTADVMELRLSIDRKMTSAEKDYPLLNPDEYDYTAFLTLHLADGRETSFNLLSFRQNGQGGRLASLNAVLTLCRQFPEESIAICDAELVDAMIADEKMSTHEAVLFREIFSLTGEW
ncbi:MAG: hypothetical protein E7459_10145 [Ruminococcaceae bacterium]|nr:hypothetical protein [Oscillospiraceae bacterium]